MNKCLLSAVGLLLAFALASCGSSSSGSSCGFSDPESPTYDLNGDVWSLDGTTPTNDCPAAVTSYSGSGSFSQSGNSLNATASGLSLKGEISGSQIKFGGTISLGDQTITIDCTTSSLTGESVGSSFTFSNTTWTSDYSGGTCNGTASGTFTRTQ